MAKKLTEEQKKELAKRQAAMAAFKAGADVVALTQEYTAKFEQLERGLYDIIEECGNAVTAFAFALDFVEYDEKSGRASLVEGLNGADTKRRLHAALSACTSNKYLLQTCALWEAVVLSGGDQSKIKSQKDLKEESKVGNDVLGVKTRGTKRKATVTPISAANGAPDLWGPLAEVLKTQAGQAMCRQVLNKAGFEMSVLKTSVEPMPETTATAPQSNAGGIIGAGADTAGLARTLKLDEQLRAQAHAEHVAKMKAKKARRAAKARKAA